MRINKDESIIRNNADQFNMDENDTVFFARELEHVKARTYDVLYPNLKAVSGEILPISMEAGSGAETITYRSFDQAGIAKFISNYADDLPTADIEGKENTIKIRSIGSSYGYSLQDIRAAAMVGRPLEARKAMAARRAIDQKINDAAFNGDSSVGMIGLLNHPNVSSYTLPADGTSSSTKFKDKTPDQILRDLNGMIQSMIKTTKNIHTPNTLVLPPDIRAYLAATPRSNVSDRTILDFFLENNGYVDRVVDCVELSGAGSGGKDMLLMYEFSPETGTLEIPLPFEQLPVQRKNLSFEVPCHARVAGVILYYPLAFIKAEGI